MVAEPPQGPGQGQELGVVTAYFVHVGVAIVKISQGRLAMGDAIWVKGHTTDLKVAVSSMQVDHQPVTEATQGHEVAIKVSDRVRRNDRVYKL